MRHILLMEAEVQLKVVVVLWHWWNERNRVREGEKRRNAQDLAFVMLKSAEEFTKLNKQMEKSERSSLNRWCKPPPGYLKVNSDGSFITQTMEGGWGFVIRDERGSVVHVAAGKLSFLRDGLQAEV